MIPLLSRTDVQVETIAPHHAEPLFRAIAQNRGHLGRWMSWSHATQSPDDCRTFIDASLRAQEATGALSLVLLQEGAVIGHIGQHGVNRQRGVCGVGYWLTASAQGHGIITDAARAVVSHAFAVQGLHRVEIHVATGNRRSSAVATRLGFRHEGTLREAELLQGVRHDVAVYGMLRQDWTP